MDSVRPCRCGAPPVEQIRGEMGPGDYWQDRQEPAAPWPFGNLTQVDGKPKRVPFHTLVEMDDSLRDDIRISCTVCANATPWGHSYKRSLDLWNQTCAV